MVGNGAKSVWSTRVLQTGIQAFVVSARLTVAAVVVAVASENAHVPNANVAQETIIIDTTGQLTLSFQAFLVEGTVCIGLAWWMTDVVFADEVR